MVSAVFHSPLDASEAHKASRAPATTHSGHHMTSSASATAPPTVLGAGYTHAWLQAYLPGAGWVPFDPTNNLMGGTELIRVGVARDPSLAAPISGIWYGERDDYIGMTVQVTVRRR